MNSIEHSEDQDTWRLVATGTTTPIEDNTPKIINICNCPELGYWCAEYITGEMKKNPFTPEAQKIQRHLEKSTFKSTFDRLSWWKKGLYSAFPKIGFISTSGKHYSYACRLWSQLVGYNKPWDHKTYLKIKLKQYLSERQAKVVEDSWAWSKLNDHDYYFDIWSNIHYGYVGYHIGFSEDVLTGGASAIQLYHDELGQKHTYQYHSENGNFFNRFDDVTDQISIRLGIDLAKEKSPQELQLHDLVSKLEEVPLPWGNGESKAKRKHICLQ